MWWMLLLACGGAPETPATEAPAAPKIPVDGPLAEWAPETLDARLKAAGFRTAECKAGSAPDVLRVCKAVDAKYGLTATLRTHETPQAASQAAKGKIMAADGVQTLELELSDLETAWKVFRAIQAASEPALDDAIVTRIATEQGLTVKECVAGKRDLVCIVEGRGGAPGSISFLPGPAPKGPADKDVHGVARQDGERSWVDVGLKSAEGGPVLKRILGR